MLIKLVYIHYNKSKEVFRSNLLMKIAFATLGCKVNQFETQALEILAKERGHEVVAFSECADAYVINTCSVTAVSDKKSRQLIRKTIRRAGNALIAVCGCFSQTKPEAASAIEGVDIVFGTNDKNNLISAIEKAEKQKCVDRALSRREFEILPAGSLMEHTRAMLKVQDGCVNFCSYCIIPYARGPVRSMPIETAVSEAIRLRDAGYKEIIVTGIEISSYGVDLTPKSDIITLVSKLCNAVPDVRIRLGSLEPRTITKEFCDKLKKCVNLCPQFHLSLQSGCDETLARMKRKYDTVRYLESVRLLNDAFSNCAITTDLIVGFPGEDEDEFAKTLEFIEKCKFAMMHIFPYSKREGTPAATMPDQVQNSEKESRAARVAQIANKMQNEYLTTQIDKELSVLFEEQVNGTWQGHSENYVLVRVECGENLKNTIKKVKIISAEKDSLLGILI